jgi:prevent-host-death family protein
MTAILINEAKNRLTELARLVEQGETVTVTRHGKPILDLVPHRPRGGLRPEAAEGFLRQRGVREVFPFVADDFDEPLPEGFLIRPLSFGTT